MYITITAKGQEATLKATFPFRSQIVTDVLWAVSHLNTAHGPRTVNSVVKKLLARAYRIEKGPKLPYYTEVTESCVLRKGIITIDITENTVLLGFKFAYSSGYLEPTSVNDWRDKIYTYLSS